MNFIFSGLALQVFAALMFPFFKRQEKYSYFAHCAALTGVVVSLIGTAGMLLFPVYSIQSFFYHHYWGEISFRYDSISLFFLFVIQAAYIPSLIYSYSYQRQLIKAGKRVQIYVLYFILLSVSLQLLVLANHSILFLLLWEMMALLSYLNMTGESGNDEVRKGSMMYFIATHAATFFLYVFFLVMHGLTGSWNFSDFHINATNQFIYYSLFAAGFVGFGLKAGFMPFHFWLPKAHPVAPTYLSAFLSGVIIKLGIYGIFRMLEFFAPVDAVIAWSLVAISLVSAIFGVWYALAQHDIKTLLAYHSIENIGIIGLGMGIGALGVVYNNQSAAVLGYAGALLHTLNHALFKSQLFIGSGIIYHNLHTRNIERMGGLVHYAPLFTVLFLIGSVAIAGIPPLNGFISEFLIYYGMFSSAHSVVFMLLCVAGLALIGGLAAACFNKVNSIMFLGTARVQYEKFKISKTEYVAMILPTAACIVIGLFPAPMTELVKGTIIPSGVVQQLRLSPEKIYFPDFMFMSMIFSALVLFIAVFFFLKNRIQKKYGKRITKPWGCGYQRLDSRMQYTASSFADELNIIPAKVLMIKKDVCPPEGIFPGPSSYHSHAEDVAEKRAVMPVYNAIFWVANRISVFGKSDVRSYIAYILVALVVYTILAFIWK